MLNLKMIIGSTRPGRAADKVIPWITAVASGHGAFDVEILDLRDWQLPIFGESYATIGDPRNPAFSVPEVRRWNDAIATGDGRPVDDRASAAATIMLDDLAWWGAALQRARPDGALPPAIMRQMAGQGALR